ncbi:MAG TPA: type I phosphomannose isomerase catalytic subunit [Roseiflexaceae bacterium]|nr:type I phosphomannose isomerase catalytic subunit [Roseiflexaceae bacterium]
MVLYPLLTRPHMVQPIWGGDRLAAWLGLPEPRPERLGEVWLVYDTNPVVNGPLAGRTLAEVARERGAALVGTRTAERYGADFPLLAKFIDAADRLSIQVHPDDAYAHSREAATGFHGKTEAWYILSAAPGAEVIYGLERPSSRAEMQAAIVSGRVEALMRRLPVAAGDTVFVPAGTVHAINAGIVLFEIQQKSDLTYRVYDYGRRDARTGQPRELHIEKSLDVMDYQPAPRGTVPPLPLGEGRDLLVACPLFALERWVLPAPHEGVTHAGTFEIHTLLDGAAELAWAGGALHLGRGDAAVLPAALGGFTLRPLAPGTRLLRATVPDLERDYRAPLRARGVAAERVAQTVLEEIRA